MTSLLAPIDPSASVRDRILDVAQMLFADHGYTGASTRAIAPLSGTSASHHAAATLSWPNCPVGCCVPCHVDPQRLAAVVPE